MLFRNIGDSIQDLQNGNNFIIDNAIIGFFIMDI